MPSQSLVNPFSGVMVIRDMLITGAKGLAGCAKSASDCTGWPLGGDSGGSVGGPSCRR